MRVPEEMILEVGVNTIEATKDGTLKLNDKEVTEFDQMATVVNLLIIAMSALAK